MRRIRAGRPDRDAAVLIANPLAGAAAASGRAGPLDAIHAKDTKPDVRAVTAAAERAAVSEDGTRSRAGVIGRLAGDAGSFGLLESP